MFRGGRMRRYPAARGSGSGDRSTGDSLWDLFMMQLQSEKGNPKTVGFWRRFCVLLPPRAKGCRAGARNIPAGGKHAGRGCSPQSKNEKRAVGTPAPAGCATEAARNDPRPGAEYLFYILPQKHKRLQRKVSFSRRGSLYLDRRRVSAPLPAACYQLSCVLYWATIRQIGSWRDRFL